MAPDSLKFASATGAQFEKRNTPAPELNGITNWVKMANHDERPRRAVLMELRKARNHFAGLRANGEQTGQSDIARTRKLVPSLLNCENARNPGLNAVGCSRVDEMAAHLRKFAESGGPGQQGHIRFHVGVRNDGHRVAVDAYRHREGGFTLVAVDSVRVEETITELNALGKKNPHLIMGTMILPSPNQVHEEGCHIFALNTLNAMHDYQPHMQGLHQQLHDTAKGRAVPQLSGPGWTRSEGNTHLLMDDFALFGMLPAKFFKHIQVLRPYHGTTHTRLDVAEYYNPALKNQAVNKKGQTLRERFESLNPDKPSAEFSRADRTASVDQKRLVMIDRAIAHYEGLVRSAESTSGSQAAQTTTHVPDQRRTAGERRVAWKA